MFQGLANFYLNKYLVIQFFEVNVLEHLYYNTHYNIGSFEDGNVATG